MEPYLRFTQRGAGLPFLGASVQDFINTAQDFDLARFSRSSSVSSLTPEALKTHDSSLTPAIFVEISIIFYSNPCLLAQPRESLDQSRIILIWSDFKNPWETATWVT